MNLFNTHFRMAWQFFVWWHIFFRSSSFFFAKNLIKLPVYTSMETIRKFSILNSLYFCMFLQLLFKKHKISEAHHVTSEICLPFNTISWCDKFKECIYFHTVLLPTISSELFPLLPPVVFFICWRWIFKKYCTHCCFLYALGAFSSY